MKEGENIKVFKIIGENYILGPISSMREEFNFPVIFDFNPPSSFTENFTDINDVINRIKEICGFNPMTIFSGNVLVGNINYSAAFIPLYPNVIFTAAGASISYQGTQCGLSANSLFYNAYYYSANYIQQLKFYNFIYDSYVFGPFPWLAIANAPETQFYVSTFSSSTFSNQCKRMRFSIVKISSGYKLTLTINSLTLNSIELEYLNTPITFSITYIPVSCILSGPTSAQEGDEITVTVTPNEGYVFTGAQYVTLTTESDVETPEFTIDGNDISFIMPNGAVQVTVRCVKSNPYDEGGDSSINGGGGTFDNPDDVIDGPSLPSLSAIASGFIRMYNPTQGELTDFSAWLQDSSVFTAAFRDMFGKPIENVVSLAIAPFIPPRSDEKDYVVISGTRSVGIQMYQVPRQYTEIDCGEITPKEYWGGFLDYAPFTKTSLYLPYVGYREINVNEIMEKPLKVFYHIDVFTGASVCFVMCGGNVLYHYDCNVLTNVPFGATEYNNFVSGVLNIAAQSATIAAAGTSGVGAAMIPSAATNIAASAANMVRPSFPHSGVVTANSGLLSIKTPYLILERPRQATPKDINRYTGFPSYVTSRLSDLSGYTKISDIHLENVPASDDELSEIETLLRNGVIL